MDRTGIALALLCYLQNSLAHNTTWTEHDLHEHLFKTYNPDIIPKLNTTKPMKVDVEFFVLAVDDIDEKKQTIAVRAFLEVKWKDELLTWDEENYFNVTTINVKNEELWLPDLSLTGTLGALLDVGQGGGRAKVTSDGNVTTWPSKLFTIACKITVRKFPIDEQKCAFDFLSWTNPSSVIQLTNPSGKMNMEFLSENGEWEAVSQDTNVSKRPFESDHWDHLTFKLLLRRKWLFHALNTMTPIVCISLLNVLCFLLPAQSGERVTLCISIFLTLAVFLTVINNAMPESSEEVAVFGLYVGLQLVGSALTIFHVVLSICFYHRDNSKPVPLLFRCMIKLCCVSPAKKTDRVQNRSSGCGNFGNSTDKSVTMETKTVQRAQVSWVLVSLALDRLCLVGAICWHVTLFLYLINDLNS